MSETSLGVELLRTLGPFSAAGVALFIALRTESRERRRQPRLRLLFDAETDDFEVAVGSPPAIAHWVRLRVASQGGRRTAEDVEVIVVDVTPRRPASLNGFTLLWSNLPESGPSLSLPLASRQTIPPGVARHVDLLYLPVPDRSAKEHAACSARLQVQPARADDRHHLRAGITQVLLAVTARDTDAAYYRVTIDFDGKWVPDVEIKYRLRVSVAPHTSGETTLRPAGSGAATGRTRSR